MVDFEDIVLRTVEPDRFVGACERGRWRKFGDVLMVCGLGLVADAGEFVDSGLRELKFVDGVRVAACKSGELCTGCTGGGRASGEP